MQLYFIFSLIASIIVIIFAITNAAAVPVRIFFAEYELSLALVIFISTAFGAIIASMLGLVRLIKQKLQIKKLHNENQALIAAQKKLQEEISSLEAMQSTVPSNVENDPIIETEV
ncbi:MAG: hypothetical protein A2Y23_00310 [Clostridiales bacterium GWB2_37_7]|nr:MAG: hypothetical protein A2Y23_00310 [Clostridiales bacterium GWB2_37_7]